MIRVLQLIDSLEAGGAERLSVSLANTLSNEVEGSFLCATRSEGILKSTISSEVDYLFLQKKSSLDFRGILRLRKFIKGNDINIIHAHSTSYFTATLVKLIFPKVKLIWHDHYGDREFMKFRSKIVLKLCSLFFSNIFCVNQRLLNWSKENLYCKEVIYLQNFVLLNPSEAVTQLNGDSGKRVLCLANLRYQKDHLTLFKAFKMLVKVHPGWTLHCVGKDFNDPYSHKLYTYVNENNLSKHVYFYGSCADISHVLSQSSIGILSSKSEGLPISLLEYGFGQLAVIATDVGDCKLVIDSPDKGLIVNSEKPESLYKALKRYVENAPERLLASKNLNKSVIEKFSKTAIINEVLNIYKGILNNSN